MLGRPYDWEQFTHVVRVGGTTTETPPGMEAFIEGNEENTIELFELFNTEEFSIFFKLPISDINGRDVGIMVSSLPTSRWA
jgi:hypothetical protein